MQQGGGEGVARADGISQLNGKPGGFNIFAIQQKRAALGAAGNADSFKLESVGDLAAELLQAGGFDAAHLFFAYFLDPGEFLMVEFEDVSLLNESTDQLGRIGTGTKIYVVETAGRWRRIQQSLCEIARGGAHLLQGAKVNPAGRRREQRTEIGRSEGREIISGGAMDAVLRSKRGIKRDGDGPGWVA